jgi:hypothetical protein
MQNMRRGTIRQSSVMADSADLEHQLALLERESRGVAASAQKLQSQRPQQQQQASAAQQAATAAAAAG